MSERHWWLRGRGFCGQSAFGRPCLIYLRHGRLIVRGRRRRPILEAPIDQLELYLTAYGNLRIVSTGSRLTVLPSTNLEQTPGMSRLLDRLPPELRTDHPRAGGGDPLGAAVASAFSADASGPVREIAGALVDHGAQLVQDRPYSRARVWLAALLVILGVLAACACGTLLVYWIR